MDRRAPYRILGIPVGATDKEVRKAYRRLAMKYHPDHNPEDPWAEEKFKEIQLAYEALSEEKKNRKDRPMAAYRWRYNDPFSDFSHPFFNFYMLAKKCFFVDREKEPASKKRRSKGNTR
jgi:curved DNA-binding protein CbpA